MSALATAAAYSVIRSNRKSFEIAVLPDGSVRIRAPQRATDEDVRRVVDRKAVWIAKQQQSRPSGMHLPENRKYITGETLLYLGASINLEVIVGKPAVRLINQELVVGVTESEASKCQPEAVKEALIVWYRKRAEEIILSRMRQWQNRFGQAPTKVRVKEQKRRWGSCTGRNEILMNWKLVMAPEDVIDYVVLHELCHLKIRDHSPRFWALVEEHMPDWKKKRQWLKEHGHLLAV